MHQHVCLGFETWLNLHTEPWRKDTLVPGLSRNLLNGQVPIKYITEQRHHCIYVESTGIVAHACNASTEEAKAGRSQVWSQSGLHCESLSPINNKNSVDTLWVPGDCLRHSHCYTVGLAWVDRNWNNEIEISLRVMALTGYKQHGILMPSIVLCRNTYTVQGALGLQGSARAVTNILL